MWMCGVSIAAIGACAAGLGNRDRQPHSGWGDDGGGRSLANSAFVVGAWAACHLGELGGITRDRDTPGGKTGDNV